MTWFFGRGKRTIAPSAGRDCPERGEPSPSGHRSPLFLSRPRAAHGAAVPLSPE